MVEFKVGDKAVWKDREYAQEWFPDLVDSVLTVERVDDYTSLYLTFEEFCEGVYVLAELFELYHGGDTPKEQDVVNSPNHYSLFPGVEAITIIASSLTLDEYKGYCLGNLLKYRLRCGKKDNVEQELAKADKYKELFEKYKHLCKQE